MVKTFIIVSEELKGIAEDMFKDIFNVSILAAPYLPKNTWLVKKATALDYEKALRDKIITQADKLKE